MLTYVYDASGVKLLASYKTAVPASNHTIAYCGNMIYEDDTFKQVLFDGGYITFTDIRAMYHYYLKDHLGRRFGNHTINNYVDFVKYFRK